MHEIRLGSGALQLCVFCGRSVRALHVASMDLHAALLGRRPEINEQSPAAAVPKSVAVPKSAMTSIMWFTKAVAAYAPVANPSTTHCTDTYIFSPNRKTSRTTKGDGEERRGARGRGPPHARCPGGAHRWSSESERGAAPTEHPTRHRASEGLGHGSFFSSLPLHCRKNKGR